VDNAFISPCKAQTMHTYVLSHFICTQQHCCFPKNLMPWRDSNPGLLIHEADAMSTVMARATKHFNILHSKGKYVQIVVN
jgi:hypothetical protein